MQVRVNLLPLACAILLTAYGSTARAQDEAAQSSATPDSLIANAIENLRAGRSFEAVQGFLGSSEMMAGRTSELQMLARQVDGAIALYGRLFQCEEVNREDTGTLVSRRIFFCQHARLVTRWQFVVARTHGGWVGAAFSFDDKIQDGTSMRQVVPSTQIQPTPGTGSERVSDTGDSLVRAR